MGDYCLICAFKESESKKFLDSVSTTENTPSQRDAAFDQRYSFSVQKLIGKLEQFLKRDHQVIGWRQHTRERVWEAVRGILYLKLDFHISAPDFHPEGLDLSQVAKDFSWCSEVYFVEGCQCPDREGITFDDAVEDFAKDCFRQNTD